MIFFTLCIVMVCIFVATMCALAHMPVPSNDEDELDEDREDQNSKN